MIRIEQSYDNIRLNKILMLFVLAGLTIAIILFFSLPIGNHAFAIEYTNYTSEKYGIQFEYPSDWELDEKTSEFDRPQITISNPRSIVMMSVIYYKDHRSSGIEELTNSEFKQYTIPTLETKVIEPPSFLTIGGEKGGTYLFTMGNNMLATQFWHVYTGNDEYVFSFISSPNEFDSNENIEIRNQFINSIKFLGSDESQQKSRFD